MPSKKKKTKSTRTKSTSPTAKRAKKTTRNKRAKPPTKQIKKKQSTKKASQTRPARKLKAMRPGAQRMESSSSREGAISNRQSGDLEGLSRTEQADSQSVDELVEEGNVVEAGVVAGVEEADNQDTKEVHTHEVPEDDVPGEYLEKE
ncbi:MAG TPA: hypothetical protein VJQ54_11475 [Candidatus Sulfotelmatobacter sp.]|nr:hypothetical protein [Candidatus Sulfotelmatobacter sp.]